VNLLDIVIVIPLIYAGYKGFKHGLIIEVFTLLALIVGLYAGIHFSDTVAAFLKKQFKWDSPYLPVISFTLVFLGLGAMIYFAGKAIERVVKVVHLSPLNKIFGSVFGLLKALYFVSVGIVLLESYDEKGNFFPKEKKEASYLYNPVKKVSEVTIPGMTSSNIFLKNELKEETDSTGLSVEDVLRAKEIADSLGIDANDAMEIKRIHKEYVADKRN
jgi:membrane protein required for colicin V production